MIIVIAVAPVAILLVVVYTTHLAYCGYDN